MLSSCKCSVVRILTRSWPPVLCQELAVTHSLMNSCLACRHGCHSSAESSYPAVLPLLTLILKSLLGGATPQLMSQLLEALWGGWQRLLGSGLSSSGGNAAADAFVECLCWSLAQVGQHADEELRTISQITLPHPAVFRPTCSR